MHGETFNLTLGSGWLSAGLLNPLGLFCLALITSSAVGVAVLAHTLHRSNAHAHRPRLARRLVEVFTGDGGTATMEFALVSPVLLFFSLLLAQTTLMMSGNLFVNYAAFMAARSAIVQIPLDKTEEGYESANQFGTAPESPKYAAVHRAASFALLPVAGRFKDSDASSDSAIVAGMNRYYQSYSADTPAWIQRQLNAKALYALENTHIKVYETWARGDKVYLGSRAHDGADSEAADYTFGPKDPVTVMVQHKFNLAFPYVSVLFADGRLDDKSGGGLYSMITAFCTLTNEGIIDAMPETPTQRNPPSGRR